MTEKMNDVCKYLYAQRDLTGQVYVHHNTRRALERRGYVVALGAGRFGLTDLGLRAVKV